jgi:peptidoglycan/LPS O-acetylase OafA/YrhL
MPPRTEPLVLVQGLRAIAALLVLVGHTQGQVITTAAQTGHRLEAVASIPGGFGVDLFFAISGFIMVVSSQRLFGREDARRAFLLRRAFRLVPLYWIATLCYLPLLVLGARGYHGDLLLALGTSLAFIPFPAHDLGPSEIYPIYTLGWSLNFEVFFYLLFALFIVMPMRRAVAAVACALLFVVAVGLAASPQTIALRFWSQPIVLEFGLGVAIGFAWLQGSRIRAPMAATLALAALTALLLDPLDLSTKAAGWTPNDLVRLVGWGWPAATLLAAAVFFEKGRSIDPKPIAPLVHLGNCSYSLYLMHPLALLIIAKAWKTWHLERLLGWGVLAALLFAGSIAMALLAHRWIEKPLTQGLNQRFRPAE